MGWFFYALKHYLINVNTNVSNAKMNIPKAIRSLKSKCFLSISTTPILCKNRGQPPCNTVVSYCIILSCFNTADNSYNCHIAKKKAIARISSTIAILINMTFISNYIFSLIPESDHVKALHNKTMI